MKWEYQYIGASSLDEEPLNRLGAQGWEAVCLVSTYLLFKRLKPEPHEATMDVTGKVTSAIKQSVEAAIEEWASRPVEIPKGWWPPKTKDKQ